MSNAMTPEQEAAAMWGSAQNPAYSHYDRLMCALKALEFYGGLAERVEALVETAAHTDTACIPASRVRIILGGQP